MRPSLFRQLFVPRWIALVVISFFLITVLFLTVALFHDFDAVWNLPFLSLWQKIQLTLMLYINPLAHMGIFTLAAMIVASLLGALNIMLNVYIRTKRNISLFKIFKGENVIATLFVSLGMGCAACGSAVLLSVLSLLGIGLAAWLTYWIAVVLLIAAIVILSYSNYRLYRQAQNPLVCEI